MSHSLYGFSRFLFLTIVPLSLPAPWFDLRARPVATFKEAPSFTFLLPQFAFKESIHALIALRHCFCISTMIADWQTKWIALANWHIP
jgi:hypothetical protein